MSEAANSEPGFTQGADTSNWPNHHLHLDSSCGVSGGPKTTMVSSQTGQSNGSVIDMLRFMPPHLNKEKSNIENSENTSLFLVSCYEYILAAMVMSVGPPFRQSMSHNCTSSHILKVLY
jgi:hypothetical protein